MKKAFQYNFFLKKIFENIFLILFFQIEVHEELAEADKVSTNGSEILANSDEEGPLAVPVCSVGNGNGATSRSTIMFVIKSHQDISKTAEDKEQNGTPSPCHGGGGAKL